MFHSKHRVKDKDNEDEENDEDGDHKENEEVSSESIPPKYESQWLGVVKKLELR